MCVTVVVKSLSTSAKSFGEPDHDETIKRNSGDVEEHVEEDEPEKEDTMVWAIIYPSIRGVFLLVIS